MSIQESSATKNHILRSYFVFIVFNFVFYYFLVFLASAILSTQYVVAEVTTSRNFITYENRANGFKIGYPSNWEKLEFSGDVEEGHRKMIVNFISPSESPSDTFREYLIIEISTGSGLSIQYHINSYLISLESLPNFKIVESSTFSLAGSPAQKLVYTYSNPEVGLTKTMDVLVSKSEKLYLLSFNSDALKYNSYLPTVQKMIDSFQFI
ncbi:MAG TPA: PsbP-related protein [Nitrososphaeraceae archaeon]|nr:PsbP-related protein [Nitrososphaeraceae archaeon]